jgi:uncharacterized membrane protein (UPF0127 family)
MKDMNYPLDMIFINMSKEVVAVRSLKPGNFETSVEGVRFVLEVNKDAGLVGGTYAVRQIFIRSWNG